MIKIIPQEIKQNAKLIIQSKSHDAFEKIITTLENNEMLFSETLIDTILLEGSSDIKNRNIIRDILYKYQAVSKIFSITKNGHLTFQLMSNLISDIQVADKTFVQLEEKLKSQVSNIYTLKSDITEQGLRQDYRRYINDEYIYKINREEINKNVILGCLFDAMVTRKEKIAKSYFCINTDHYIVSNNTISDVSIIALFFKEVLQEVKNQLQSNKLKQNTAVIEQSLPQGDDKTWTRVFRIISNDLSTLQIRQDIKLKVNRFLSIKNASDNSTFKANIQYIAEKYFESYPIKTLRNVEDTKRINDIIEYLYLNDKNLEKDIIENIEINTYSHLNYDHFIEEIIKIYLLKDFAFLCRIIKKHKEYYYIFTRAYVSYMGTDKIIFTNSFFKILRSLLHIKQDDDFFRKSFISKRDKSNFSVSNF